MEQVVDKVIAGKAYVDGRIEEVAIAIDDERIVAITKPSKAPRATEVEIVKGKRVILPGMVDIHVHMRDLGQSYKEDWYTGTFSAIKGGVTLVIDMPNNVPPIDSVDALRRKMETAREKALVDYLFYMGYPKDIKELDKVIRMDTVGIKLYPEDLKKDELKTLLSLCSKMGLPVVFHAEDPEILHIDRLGEMPEIRGIEKVLDMVDYKVHIHITHVSLSKVAERIIRARGLGYNITFDVTIHHMLLNNNIYDKLGGLAYVRPPLRSEENRSYIFNLVKGGLPNAIITDHAPHTLDEKKGENPSPGFPGLEIAFPLLFTQILDGKLPLNVIDLYSAKPATLFNIAKGSIMVGNDADLIVVRYDVERRVKPEDFVSKAKYSPFKGWTLRCEVEKVFIRGNLVYDTQTLLVRRGYGRQGRRFKCRTLWAQA
ncbi:MAG: hypothetical protein DRZ82_00880 [Thermoprotei archaeon]|nr:MAG: hypothetical protein DRZ82_00880 [Thermoprotei archaeon]